MHRLFVALIITLLTSACAPPITLSLPYSPQSTEELKGVVDVGDFGYFPKEGIAQNEIRQTAMGRIYLTEDVGVFMADAVRRELRQSGLSLRGDNLCRLDGEVNEFLLDSLGYSTDYETDIRYILSDAKGVALFDNSYVVKFNASKFVAADMVIANINKSVADNIKQLLRDEHFIRNLEQHCQESAPNA